MVVSYYKIAIVTVYLFIRVSSNSPIGYTSLDIEAGANFKVDLNQSIWNIQDNSLEFSNPTAFHIGEIIPSNSVGIVRAYHVLEHLDNPINFFNEVYRILAPGGLVLLEVPSVNHPMAFADPTHKTFWSVLNFLYYTNEEKAKYIRPSYKGAFLSLRTDEYKWNDGTLIITAQLLCLKGWYNDGYWGNKQTDEKYIENYEH